MRMLHLIFCFSLAALETFSQAKKDSVLLYENTLTRPITLHSGQLQLNASYGFAINSKRYDNDGIVIHLNDEGLSNIGHRLAFEIKYGITEHIGMAIKLGHVNESERAQMGLIFAPPDPTIETNELRETSGFTDLYLGADFRVPFKTRIFDIGASAGMYLPTAKHEPDQPSHVYNDDPAYITLLYHYTNHWGYGVPVANVGAQFKIRANKWGFYGSAYYRRALREGKNVHWRFHLEDNSIIYESESYAYMLNSETGYIFSIEYQPIPWMNIFTSLQGYRCANGWSEQTARKVSEFQKSFSSINPGFEITATSRFWLRQQMIIPLGGRNDFGPFGITTSASYNLFPFNR